MNHSVISSDQWLAELEELTEREKELTKQRDELAQRRRDLPWTRLEKHYTFATTRGEESLGDLFKGKTQLFVQHFMFDPSWQEGCTGCSFEADHLHAALPHLLQRDLNVVLVSRAPLDVLQAYRKRMGWDMEWVSSLGSDFNTDFNVSVKSEGGALQEVPGNSVFFKHGKEVYRTYSSYERGCEILLTTYMLLDLLPKGRDEGGYKVHPMEWVKRHDEYTRTSQKGHCC